MSDWEQHVLGPFEKYAWEEVPLGVDFAPWIGGDTVQASDVAVFTTADVDVSTSMLGTEDRVGTIVRAIVKGGTNDTTYYVRYRVETTTRKLECRVQLDVVNTKLAG